MNRTLNDCCSFQIFPDINIEVQNILASAEPGIKRDCWLVFDAGIGLNKDHPGATLGGDNFQIFNQPGRFAA